MLIDVYVCCTMLHCYMFRVHWYLNFCTVYIHSYVESHLLWQITDIFFDMKLWSCMIAVNVQSVLYSNELISHQLWQLHVKHFFLFVTAVSHINNSFNFYNLSVNYMLHSNLWIFLDVLKDFGLILCYALLFCSVLIVKLQTWSYSQMFDMYLCTHVCIHDLCVYMFVCVYISV